MIALLGRVWGLIVAAFDAIGTAVLAIVLAASIGLWIWVYGPWPLKRPPDDESVVLRGRLLTQSHMAPIPGDLVVQSWVLQLPEGTRKGSLLIGRQPQATLHGFGRVLSPAEVLDEPGLYLSVSDNDDQLVYIARLTDPGLVRHERFEARFDVGFGTHRGGVIAARAPFVRQGVLRVFEVDSQDVSRVVMRVPLRRWPFARRGRRYLVPGP